ncbi:MAG: hypothetical protein QM820_35680 [Minicystis sp.]
MNHRISSSAPRASFLRRGLAAAAAGLLGTAILTAPSLARASWSETTVAEWALEGIVGQLAGEGVSALLFGTSTTTKLSSTDITQIQTLISDALDGYVSTTIKTEAQDVISKVATYQRGTTSSDLSTAMTNATTIVNEADDVLNAITGQSSATNVYSLASTYKSIALIKIAFLQEQQAIAAAQCVQGTCSSVNYGAKVVAAAETILTKLNTFNSDFEGQFPSDASSSFTVSYENDYSVNGSKSSSFLQCTENTSLSTSYTRIGVVVHHLHALRRQLQAHLSADRLQHHERVPGDGDVHRLLREHQQLLGDLPVQDGHLRGRRHGAGRRPGVVQELQVVPARSASSGPTSSSRWPRSRRPPPPSTPSAEIRCAAPPRPRSR